MKKQEINNGYTVIIEQHIRHYFKFLHIYKHVWTVVTVDPPPLDNFNIKS